MRVYYSYDDKKRPVQIQHMYPDGSILVESLEYGFSGEITSSVTEYEYNGSIDRIELTYVYDIRGRKISETAKLLVKGMPTMIAGIGLAYDELGRLYRTNTAMPNGTVVTSKKTYGLQGWLNSIKVTLDDMPLFAQTFGYDSEDTLAGTYPQYTGLITRMNETWYPSGKTSVTTSKGYDYDYAGRLAKECTASSQTDYAYDSRGNLRSAVGSSDRTIFSCNGYRLSTMRVTGASGTRTVTFAYDDMGRMTYDGDSNLEIDYNHLDLVGKISRNGAIIANYFYLADGTKSAVLDNSGEGLVYRGPFVYRRSSDSSLTLETASFSGGLLKPDGALLYVRDHLGSVRLVVDGATGSIYKASVYDAYGSEAPVTALQTTALPDGVTLRETYTGKEDQSLDFGIPYLDFGARQYSATLKCWMVPDPMSEKYYGMSPYAFCNNNPINYVDSDGNAVETLWDIASIGMGIRSLVQNVQSGNVRGAVGDGVGIVIDAVAAAVPFIPGGVGAVRAGAKAAKSVDATTVDKVVQTVNDVGNALKAKKPGEKALNILPENQIDRGLLDKPTKRGNAFVFKNDGSPVEIHHVDQSTDGPYVEMHMNDHRGKGNYKENHPKSSENSRIDRQEFAKQRRPYWQKEYDKYYK